MDISLQDSGATVWSEQAPSHETFETFPWHERPAPEESQSGYLLRLMESNAIETLPRLRTLILPWTSARAPGASRVFAYVDFPLRTWELLETVTAAPVDDLRATTMYYLGRKFERTTTAHLATFLADDLSACQRYCPKCLAAGRWYRLQWRFLDLAGCLIHACSLLDRCGHCGAVIPLLKPPQRVGECPACQGDLGACGAEPLDHVEAQRALDLSEDMTFLLARHTEESERQFALWRIGRVLRKARKQLGVRQVAVAAQLGVSPSQIRRMEHGGGVNRGFRLQHFLAYARYLGLSAREVLECAQQDPDLLAEIRDACAALRANGEQVTLRTVAQRIGLAVKRDLPLLRSVGGATIGEAMAQQRENRRQELRAQRRERIRSALEQLLRQPAAIAPADVAEVAEISVNILLEDAEYRDLIREAQAQHYYWNGSLLSPLAREEKLLARVQQVVEVFQAEQKPVTLETLAHEAPCTVHRLLRSARIQTYLASVLPGFRVPTPSARHFAWMKRVEESCAALLAEGRDITVAALSERSGVPVYTLRIKSYFVSMLFDVAGQVSPQEQAERAAQRSDELLKDVEAAVADLEARSEQISAKAVAGRMGMTPRELKRHLAVRAALEELHVKVYAEKAPLTEEVVRRNVDRAVEQIRTAGQVMAVKRIVRDSGLSAETLRWYPAVWQKIRLLIAETSGDR